MILVNKVDINQAQSLGEQDPAIDKLREEMLELARLFGLKHELTISKSQELDAALNKFLK